MRVPFDEVKETIKQALLNAGLSEKQAEICAQIHTESSADGVESHGLNRIPRFVDYAKRGLVNLSGEAELVGAKGAVENYDGHMGIGVINALFCSDRAIELAKEHGIGCVALKNTTHWMRGGAYAWHMAQSGYMGICWTNTESNMPMWGSDKPGVGNNPFCIGIPREAGPIVLDMAMSQYAYGKLGVYRLAGKQLPYPGGFDEEGNLTTDPGAIEKTRRMLPIGYWKGSSMSIVLDLAAALMSNGMSGSDIDEYNVGSSGGCSQVFIAYDPYLFGTKEEIQDMLDHRVAAADASHPIKEGSKVTCPGERTMQNRIRSMKEGVQVDEPTWKQVRELAGISD
jgi:3-dehydro-L-gulonate 2-dehydrogenase